MKLDGTLPARLRRHLLPAVEAAPDGGRVRLRTLVLIRWVAVAGQLAALVIVHVSLGYDLPLLPALALVALSVAVNVHASMSRPGSAWLGPAESWNSKSSRNMVNRCSSKPMTSGWTQVSKMTLAPSQPICGE